MPSADAWYFQYHFVSFDFYQHFITYDCVAGFFMPGCDGGIGYGFRGQGPEYLRYSLCILYLFDVQRVINQILLLFLVNGHIPDRRRGGGRGGLHNAEKPKTESLHGNDAGCSTMRPGRSGFLAPEESP